MEGLRRSLGTMSALIIEGGVVQNSARAESELLDTFVQSVWDFIDALRTRFRKDEDTSDKLQRLQRQMRQLVFEVSDSQKMVVRKRLVEEFYKTLAPLHGRIAAGDCKVVAEVDSPTFKDLAFDNLFDRCNEKTQKVVLQHLDAMCTYAKACIM